MNTIKPNIENLRKITINSILLTKNSQSGSSFKDEDEEHSYFLDMIEAVKDMNPLKLAQYLGEELNGVYRFKEKETLWTMLGWALWDTRTVFRVEEPSTYNNRNNIAKYMVEADTSDYSDIQMAPYFYHSEKLNKPSLEEMYDIVRENTEEESEADYPFYFDTVKPTATDYNIIEIDPMGIRKKYGRDGEPSAANAHTIIGNINETNGDHLQGFIRKFELFKEFAKEPFTVGIG
jgi:hypothetical protein